MKYNLHGFMILISLLSFAELNAGHMLGGEITYRSLGGKKYEITARIYRNCENIPFNSPTFYLFAYQNGGSSTSLNYTRTAIQDYNPQCPDSTNVRCKTNTTMSFQGVELHTFMATVDFGVSPYKTYVDNQICQIGIAIEQCCRTSVTTLTTANFYIEAMLDLCNSKFNNSSPKFQPFSHIYPVCNQPYLQNFGGYDYTDYDSLLIELDGPLNAHNSYDTYNGSFSKNIPMTPYCPPNPGQISCKPVINGVPPRGFYFNPLNGDVVVTPTKCDEMAVICARISEFRKDSLGVWRRLGFVTREIQLTMNNNQPKNYTHTNTIKNNYRFKYGQKTCIDFSTYDTIVSGYSNTNRGDKTFINIFDKPAGMSFAYTDSSAPNKTGRLCWNVPDSIYQKAQGIAQNKNIPVTIEIRDNFCPYPYIVRKTINIQITPPDSFGHFVFKTYDDKNRNHLKDAPDTLMPVLLKLSARYSNRFIQTDSKGHYQDSIWSGVYSVGVVPHPYYDYASRDTTFILKNGSTCTVNLLTGRSPGIYGRIYQDANANCKFDTGEKTFQGYKVHTDNNLYTGISDRDGLFFIKAPKGQYTLKCEAFPSKFSVACPGSKSITISIDGTSSYYGNDFGIVPDPAFADLSVGMTVKAPGINTTNNWITFYCRNNGTKTRKNIQLKCQMPADIPLYLNNLKIANGGAIATIQIDSIRPGQTLTKVYDARVSSAYFKSGDKITFTCYTDSLSTLADSIKTNNTASEYRIVNGPSSVNEKRISRDSVYSATDEYISYTIHFQNQGLDTVTRVVISDTLDKKRLDISKFTLNWSDYPCETIISDNVINFIFNDIRLPNSGTLARGGLNFTVGLRKVNHDTGFMNKAHVFLDFQNPVYTSKAIARMSSPIVLHKLMSPVMCRYEKNKVHYSSTLSFGTGNQMILELSDTSGSFASPVVLKTITTQSKSDSIDFVFPNNLASGNYKIRIRSSSPAYTSVPSGGHMELTVATIPVFTIISNMKNNGICDMDTLKISGSMSGYFYKILKNNMDMGNFTAQQTYNLPVTAGDKFKMVSMENNTQCKDTLNVNLTVFPQPAISLVTKSSKTDFCIHDAITLQGKGAKFYQFYRNDTIIQVKSTVDTLPVILKFTSRYKVSAESADGCTNTPATLDLVANAPPASFTVSAVPVDECVGDSFHLNYSGDPSNYYVSYRNDTLIKTKTTEVVLRTIAHSVNDKFSVIAMNPKGCTLKNTNINLSIHPLPAKPVIVKSGNTLSVDPTGISVFKWYRNGTLLSNSGNSIGNAGTGTYKVMVTSAEGCSAISDDFSHIHVGINYQVTESVKVYPNPAHTVLTIENPGNGAYFVNIYDPSGKLVMSREIGSELADLDVGHLSPGIYLLKTMDKSQVLHVIRISIGN